MAHWRTMIEKDYLGAWDLTDDDGKPRSFTLTIRKVSSVALKTKETPKGKRKVVIVFDGAKKHFVANATNCEAIESMYGGDTNGWIGQRVTLFQTDVRNPKAGKGGQPATVKGIRVQPGKPRGPAEVLPDREVDPEVRAEQDAAFGREPGEEG